MGHDTDAELWYGIYLNEDQAKALCRIIKSQNQEPVDAIVREVDSDDEDNCIEDIIYDWIKDSKPLNDLKFEVGQRRDDGDFCDVAIYYSTPDKVGLCGYAAEGSVFIKCTSPENIPFINKAREAFGALKRHHSEVFLAAGMEEKDLIPGWILSLHGG
ncbi:hypothetical protein H0H92_011034 [Tricholoma furcatifolium]|nr:hypothetical protein H0H92_011034 [Tricholoma furcatifolium]